MIAAVAVTGGIIVGGCTGYMVGIFAGSPGELGIDAFARGLVGAAIGGVIGGAAAGALVG